MKTDPSKRTIKEQGEIVRLLSFIENNTAKEDFIAWLNTQQGKSYSEGDDWEYLKAELQGEGGVDFKELQTYAKTLGDEQDTHKLLKEVQKSTEHAEKAVEKLSYLSYFKKFSVAVGGATVFVGLLFLVFSVAILFHFLGINVTNDLRTAVVSLSIFVGLLNIIAGLLLATR